MDIQVWTEKYRPFRLDDVVNQSHVVDRLKAMVKAGSIPNMLFAGTAGVGKTTAALCLAHELFGEHWRENFQETNASVTPDTPILIREKGKISRTDFGELADKCFKDDKAKYAEAGGTEILSIKKDSYEVGFMPISNVSRHKVGKIAKIRYEGGTVKTSLDHSLIIMSPEGELISKKASELKAGDLLITFAEEIPGEAQKLDFDSSRPSEFVEWGQKRFRNPKIRTIIGDMEMNEELAWMMGMYLAEGSSTLKPSGTNGVCIFTLGYPAEMDTALEIARMAKKHFRIEPFLKRGASGFDRTRLSSVQVRLWNTQFSKFLIHNFYDSSATKNARSKHIPSFVFSSRQEERIAFLKGYMGDAAGAWVEHLRYSSRSGQALIDTVWLARICGLDSAIFSEEARITWKLPSFSYIKTEFVPAQPLLNLLGKHSGKGNPRYLLRHQLYSKKAERMSKDVAKRILSFLRSSSVPDEVLSRLSRFLDSRLSVIKIRNIEVKDYSDYVYDVSVPGSEMFWGGTSPVLLHNSDQRGIDVVRGRIKEFAMMRPIGSEFKIVFLDESDSLTPEAQQALRRTMEKFSGVCRFILSCNYSGRIIEPIQSRCSVFRFRRLAAQDVKRYLSRVTKAEKLAASDDTLDAIFEISEGDLRKATNILQACSTLPKITREGVFEVAGKVRPEDVSSMLKLALGGDFAGARKKLFDLLIGQGLAGDDVIRAVHSEVFRLDIGDRAKVDLIEKIGDYEFRLNQGGTPEIQLEALLAQFMKAGGKQA